MDLAMTPAQIEAAARELCKLRGLDPEAAGGWTFLSGEIQRFAEVGTAIAAVLQAPEKLPRSRKKTVDIQKQNGKIPANC